MTHILPQELADALNTGEGAPLEVLDPNSKRTYFVVSAETHRLAMEALRRVEDREAIARGIAEMQAGGGLPLEEAREQSLERLHGRLQ
jgi:hypothetical protein